MNELLSTCETRKKPSQHDLVLQFKMNHLDMHILVTVTTVPHTDELPNFQLGGGGGGGVGMDLGGDSPDIYTIHTLA